MAVCAAEVTAMAVLQASRVAGMDPELADLERVYASLDIPGHRVELLDGQVTVSPSGSWWHSGSVSELILALADLCRKRGWVLHTNLTLHVAATRERLIPDLWITRRDAPRFDDNEVYGHGALLVAEVVSPSSRNHDHVAKARAYAQASVPLCLVIDPVAKPGTVTLFSDPADHAYRHCDQVTAGQALPLPEPFGLDLDTARLLS
jgi:Uma2 family endonuclease